MDNQDFDKIFSEKLKETQEFEYMESDWENVLGRIEQPEQKKRRGGWLWLFGLGFLFMAATSIYLATSLQETNQHLVDLKDAIAQMEKEEVKSVIQTDTIFQQIELVQYDTVVKTIDKIVYRESIVINEGTAKSTNQQSQTIPNLTPNKKTTPSIIPKENERQKTDLLIVDFNANPGLITELEAIETKTTNTETVVNDLQNAKENLWLTSLRSSLFSNEFSWKPIPDFQEVPTLVKVNKKSKWSWKNLSVGITAGVAFSEKLDNFATEQEDAAFLDEDATVNWDKGRSIDVGLLLDYQVHPKFHLTGAISFQQINYQTRISNLAYLQNMRIDSDEVLLENLFSEGDSSGVVGSLAENTTGDYIVRQRALEYRLGGNYIFRDTKKWRPYLGVSISALSIINQQLRTDTNNSSTGSNYYNPESEKVLSTSKPSESTFRLNAIIPAAGFQWSLGAKVSWHMETYYNQPLKKREDQLNNAFGVRTGFSYRF